MSSHSLVRSLEHPSKVAKPSAVSQVCHVMIISLKAVFHRCKNLDSSTFVVRCSIIKRKSPLAVSQVCHVMIRLLKAVFHRCKNLDSSTFVRCSLHHQKEISTRRTKKSEPRLKGKQADSSVAHYYHTRKSIEDRIHFTRSFDEASIHKVAKLSETIRVSQVSCYGS